MFNWLIRLFGFGRQRAVSRRRGRFWRVVNRIFMVILLVFLVLGAVVHFAGSGGGAEGYGEGGYGPDGLEYHYDYGGYDGHDGHGAYNSTQNSQTFGYTGQYHYDQGTGQYRGGHGTGEYHYTTEDLVTVTFLDVGQGDSIVIHTGGGTVLIDASWDRYAYRIIAYLESRGIDFIDLAIATHPHADHIGGFAQIFDAFDVGIIFKPEISHTTQTYRRFIDSIARHQIPVHFTSAGDSFMMGPAVFNVVSPQGAATGTDGAISSPGRSGATDTDGAGGSARQTGNTPNLNNSSVVVHMQHIFNGFLFTADAEYAAEAYMLYYSRYHGRTLLADVLKVGHHGSRTSTSQAFLDAVAPSYAVIQVGSYNQYGHPHDAVLNRLAVAGVSVYRTDHHGTVRFYSDGFNLLRVTNYE